MKINHHKNPTAIEKLMGNVNKVTFSQNYEHFNLCPKLQIHVTESNQYINFSFIVIPAHEDDYRLETVIGSYSVSKFEIAEHYKLSSPTVLNNINFYLYIKDKNIFNNTEKIGLLDVRDAIFDNVLPFECSTSSAEVLIVDIPALIDKIIETSIWKIIN